MATVRVLIDVVVVTALGKIVMHPLKEASANRMATVRDLIDVVVVTALG